MKATIQRDATAANDYGAVFVRIEELVASGDPSAARALLTEILADAGLAAATRARATSDLAVLLVAGGRPRDGVEAIMDALRLDPACEGARLNGRDLLADSGFRIEHAALVPRLEAAVAPATAAASNVALNDQELELRRAVLASTPQRLEISSTLVCNINTPPCVQCFKHADPGLGYLKGDQAHLPRRYFESIRPALAGAHRVSLHGIGEPLANPEIFDYIEACADDAGIWFVSNALLVSGARLERLLESKLTRIDFSLDAATPETYRKIRHHDFDEAVRNIENLVRERDRRGLDRPRVRMNMTLMRANVEELPEFVRLAKRLGADNAHAFHMNQGVSYKVGWFDYEAQHCENDPETHDRCVEEAFRVAEEIGLPFYLTGKRRLTPVAVERPGAADTLYGNRKIDSERFFCDKPWTSTLVDNHGNVTNCCWQAGPVGSLENQTFAEIWNGDLLQEVRRDTARGVPHPVCATSKNKCPWLGRT